MLQEISSNVTYVFTNSEPLIDFAAPILSRVIDIGGLGAKQPKKLDEVLSFTALHFWEDFCFNKFFPVLEFRNDPAVQSGPYLFRITCQEPSSISHTEASTAQSLWFSSHRFVSILELHSDCHILPCCDIYLEVWARRWFRHWRSSSRWKSGALGLDASKWSPQLATKVVFYTYFFLPQTMPILLCLLLMVAWALCKNLRWEENQVCSRFLFAHSCTAIFSYSHPNIWRSAPKFSNDRAQ